MGWVPFQLLYLGPFSNVRCSWCRGGRYAPVAVLRDGYVSVYVPSGANDAVAELNVVMMPDEDGTYLLTPPMLANMSME